MLSGGSFGDRLSALSRGEIAGVALLLAVTLGGAGLWYVRSLPRPVEIASPAADVSSSAAPSSEVEVLLVDVAGWVRRPGVYEFRSGDRVIDALEAAGGARPGALLEALNLAAPLADGTQVLVQRAAGGAAPGVVPAPGAAGAATKVNVNTAGLAELESLPGVGEVIAQRIVDYRTQNGPFTAVDQLLEVSGIGEATLASMRDLVTV